MQNKNKFRFSKMVGGGMIALAIFALAIFGRIAAENLAADLDIGLGGVGDIGLNLNVGDTSISIGGGTKTQPGCGESNCLSVPGTDEYSLSGIEGSLREMILKWVNFFLGFLALIAMIALIYAGFLYVTSLGNEEQAKKAKNIIIWVVLGIIVILLAFALVNTLITTGPTGSDLTEI